jgi:ubiquinone/menaquinone biosynthesis C-methylase UbiE
MQLLKQEGIETMQKDYLAVFRSPLRPDEDIRFIGESNGDDMEHGLLCAGNSVVGYVKHGIPSFTAPNQHPESFDSTVEKIRSEGWIERNWERWRSGANKKDHRYKLYHTEFPRQIAETNGLIVEIGTGPGAGFVPGVLERNRKARILLNDVSIGILHSQKEYISREGVGPNVQYAAWDAMEHVLRPSSVAVVSSAGGIGNIPDWNRTISALSEALIPGGRMFMSEIARSTDRMNALPEWIREEYDLKGSWQEDLESAGFEVESYDVIHGAQITDPNESGLAKDVIEAGHALYQEREYLIARKPR